MPKRLILKEIIETGTPLKVKTNRKYIKIDPKTANLVLEYCSYFDEKRAKSYMSMGWQPIIAGAKAHAAYQAQQKVN